LGNVRSHQIVNSHLPIGWPVMPKGLISKIIVYAQKIVRRYCAGISTLGGAAERLQRCRSRSVGGTQSRVEEYSSTLIRLTAQIAQLAGLIRPPSCVSSDSKAGKWLSRRRRLLHCHWGQHLLQVAER